MHDDSAGGTPELLVDRSFDPTTTDPVDAVFRAVSETGRVDLTTAEPLACAVDPDALDAIFGRDAGNDGIEVCFQYAGLEIVVTGGGEIRVTEKSGPPAPSQHESAGCGADEQGRLGN